MGVKDFLSGISWNGTSLSDFGDADFGGGGRTDLNAGAGFAQLLEQLAQPGGVLSDEHTSKELAGVMAGLQAQREQSNSATTDALVSGGVNPAMARRLQAGEEDRFSSEAAGLSLQVGQQAAGQEAEFMTQLVNALSQTEVAQKNLQLQDYWNKKLFKESKKKSKFNQVLGVASLALGGYNIFANGGQAASSAGAAGDGFQLGSQFGLNPGSSVGSLPSSAYFP